MAMIGFIGAGHIGSQLARVIDQFGFDVVDGGPSRRDGGSSGTCPATARAATPRSCGGTSPRPSAIGTAEEHVRPPAHGPSIGRGT
jgi:hypothetical protein